MKAAILLSMALGGAVLYSGGCASAPPRQMSLTAIEHSPFGGRSLALTPLRVEDCSLRGVPGGIRLYVGAMFNALEAQEPQYSRVSLVIQAAGQDLRPMLARNRQVVFELDGEVLSIGQHPDPALYNYRPLGGGFLETMIVPISMDVLQRLSTAERITGNLGPWIRFGLSEDFPGGFESFLTAVRLETEAEKARYAVKIAAP